MLEKNIIFHDDNNYWTFGQQISKTKLSSVFNITKNDELYVAKVVNKDDKNSIEYIQNEIEILQNISHENIIKYITTINTENHLIMVLENCSSGSLEDLLKKKRRIIVDECQDLFKQVLTALRFLKNVNIVHRDIKPGNILLQINREKALDIENDNFIYDVRICDFGFATSVLNNNCIIELGTPNYIAPEMILGEKTLEKENIFKIDIWSAGVTFYTCLFIIPPFETNNKKDTYGLITSCNYSFRKSVDPLIKDLIENMIVRDPTMRLSVEELLEHDFFIQKN